MMLIRSTVALLLMTIAVPHTGFAAELRGNITVSNPTVTLGDLFDDAGAAADVAVANAPEPGSTTELSVSRISLLARRAGIDWRNTIGITHVTVARSGVSVPEAEVSSAVSSAIVAQTTSISPTAMLQVEFDGGNAGVQVGEHATPSVKVEQLSFNPRNGTFAALLRAPADDRTATLRRVSGRAYAVLNVPVMKRDIAPGEIVRNQDLDWIKLPASRVSQNTVTTETQLVGFTPRHAMRTGDMVQTSDIQQPLAVAKGALVDMAYNSGALTLMARGKAMQSGAIGDTIDIVNPRSNRTVQGVIEGPNLVRIQAMGAPRLTDLNKSSSNTL